MRLLMVLLVACTQPPAIRPIEITPRGKAIPIETVGLGIGIRAPREGLGDERAFDIGGGMRVGIADHCDAAGSLTMAALGGQARCGLLTDAPIAVTAFADLAFAIAPAFATHLWNGVSGRAGIDIGRAHGTIKPLASLAIGIGTTAYEDETKPPPPDGPVGPLAAERECRIEAQLGVQLGSYGVDGTGVSLAFAPYWLLGHPAAPFDGFFALLAFQLPR